MKSQVFKNSVFKEKIIEITGEYATANRISEIFGISLSYVYAIVKNEKIRKKQKYNRAEYYVADFLDNLDFSKNDIFVESTLSQTEKYSNIFFNMLPKNDYERYIESMLIDQLGEFTSVKKLVDFFGVSKTIWYEILDEGEIIEYSLCKRRVILTRSLLPFLRDKLGGMNE